MQTALSPSVNPPKSNTVDSGADWVVSTTGPSNLQAHSRIASALSPWAWMNVSAPAELAASCDGMSPSRSVTTTSGLNPAACSLLTAEPEDTSLPSVPCFDRSSSRQSASPTTVHVLPKYCWQSSGSTRSQLTVTAFSRRTEDSSPALSYPMSSTMRSYTGRHSSHLIGLHLLVRRIETRFQEVAEDGERYTGEDLGYTHVGSSAEPHIAHRHIEDP